MNDPSRGDTLSDQDKEPWENELLCLKIKSHLEVLLSDHYLADNGFLLKQVQRKGFVSLKLLTYFNRIKVLTTDWSMTRAAAERSELLEVNDEGTKVRRVHPLPEWLQRSPTRKLLHALILSERPGPVFSERILQTFSAYGKVSSLWVVHPDAKIPRELRNHARRCKVLGQHLCAVVKFENLEAVRRIYRDLEAEEEEFDSEGECVGALGLWEDRAEEGLCPLGVREDTSCGGASDAPRPTAEDRPLWQLNKNARGPVKLRTPNLLRVLRQPYGPDGTRGFHSSSRGRGAGRGAHTTDGRTMDE